MLHVRRIVMGVRESLTISQNFERTILSCRIFDRVTEWRPSAQEEGRGPRVSSIADKRRRHYIGLPKKRLC
jgi:hypothetical protein